MNLWRFDSLLEAHVIIEDWRIDYNTRRPHTAHDDTTPAEFTRGIDHHQPTPSRTTPGPLNGSLSMALRWTAAGMLQAERQFRKIIGHTDLVTRIDGEQHERNQTQETATPTSA